MPESVDLEAGRIERLLPILQALARSSNCSRSSRFSLKFRAFLNSLENYLHSRQLWRSWWRKSRIQWRLNWNCSAKSRDASWRTRRESTVPEDDSIYLENEIVVLEASLFLDPFRRATFPKMMGPHLHRNSFQFCTRRCGFLFASLDSFRLWTRMSSKML